MVRSFSDDPVEPAVVDRILLDALRSPTAGNTGGTAWVVLEGDVQTSAYFDATTDEAWRTEQPRWFAGLRRAPVVLLAYTSPDAYVARYAEPDKSGSGLGDDTEHWPIPYWYGDAAFGVMAVLLGAVNAGLGACVLGTFARESGRTALRVPAAWRLFSRSSWAGRTGTTGARLTRPPEAAAVGADPTGARGDDKPRSCLPCPGRPSTQDRTTRKGTSTDRPDPVGQPLPPPRLRCDQRRDARLRRPAVTGAPPKLLGDLRRLGDLPLDRQQRLHAQPLHGVRPSPRARGAGTRHGNRSTRGSSRSSPSPGSARRRPQRR